MAFLVLFKFLERRLAISNANKRSPIKIPNRFVSRFFVHAPCAVFMRSCLTVEMVAVGVMIMMMMTDIYQCVSHFTTRKRKTQEKC